MKKNRTDSLVLAVLAILVIPLVLGISAIAAKAGVLAGVACVLVLLTLPTLLGGYRVFGVGYPNKLRIEGMSNSYMADPDGSAIGINLRCKLVADTATPDATPVLQLASATERGSVVTLQPIAAGAYGACAFSNGSGGTLIGVCVGTIAHGGNVYGAANGKVSASSAGGAVLLGVCEIAGADGGTCVYVPNPAAA